MQILLDNDSFIIFNKPCGISFHSDDGPGFMANCEKEVGYKLHSIHRLDKVTSGIIIFAKSNEVAKGLSALFRDKKINKTYLALAYGKPLKKQGMVKGDMEKSRRGSYKLLRSNLNPAITRFTSQLVEPGLRLYTLHPVTGKTHQLRVAMKSLGTPILGDKLYGGSEFERVCLHSHRLEFSFMGEDYKITSDPDFLPWNFGE